MKLFLFQVLVYLASTSIRIVDSGIFSLRWEERRDGDGNPVFTTLPCIFVGTWPGTLNDTLAREAATEILAIVARHNVSDLDVAFHETKKDPTNNRGREPR